MQKAELDLMAIVLDALEETEVRNSKGGAEQQGGKTKMQGDVVADTGPK